MATKKTAQKKAPAKKAVSVKKAPAVKAEPVKSPVATGTVETAIKQLAKSLDSVASSLKKAKISATVRKHNFTERDQGIGIILNLTDNRKNLELIIDTYSDYNDPYDIKHLPKVEVLGTSTKHRQAVLLVEEVARTIQLDVVFTSFENNSTDNAFINRFPINLPEVTKWTVTKKNCKDLGKDLHNRYQWEHSASVAAKVPATKLYFLVGYDEDHMFISCLPKKAESVEEAHQILLPKELKDVKNYLRQGEFFFVPASEQDLKAIAKSDNIHDRSPLPKNDEESDHWAQVVVFTDLHEYCTGTINNDRHKTLFLNGWYKVIQNTELPNPGDSTTWD